MSSHFDKAKLKEEAASSLQRLWRFLWRQPSHPIEKRIMLHAYIRFAGLMATLGFMYYLNPDVLDDTAFVHRINEKFGLSLTPLGHPIQWWNDYKRRQQLEAGRRGGSDGS